MRINELVHLNLYKMHFKIYYVIVMKTNEYILSIFDINP